MGACGFVDLEVPLMELLVLNNFGEIEWVGCSEKVTAREVFIVGLEHERTCLLHLGQNIWQLESFVPRGLLPRVILHVSLHLLPLKCELDERILLSKCIGIFFKFSLFNYHSQ